MNIKRFSICIGAELLLLVSCDIDTYTPDVQDSRLIHPLTKTVANDTNISKKLFTEEMLFKYLESDKSKGSYSVEIVSRQHNNNVPRQSNDSSSPIMYIVNYANGGWALVSGLQSDSNQIIAYGDSGHFDPDSISNPGVKCWYELTKEQLESIEVDPSSQEITIASLPSWIDQNEVYYWVRLPEEPISTSSEQIRNHLINTKWGQGYPWNQLTPNHLGSTYCYTGCIAVSYAQILYYLHESRNFTIGLYDVAGTYTFLSDHYSITSVTRTNYNINSPKWSNMSKKFPDNGSYGYVAELMFDIAERVEMSFYEKSSAAYCEPPVFNEYGINCNTSTYDYQKVISSLNNNIPVEICCSRSTGSRHSWLIDGYVKKTTTTDYPYRWRIIPTDSLVYYNNIDYDYVLTESQKELLYPDVQENDVEHQYSVSSSDYLLMNWGWDGQYDDGRYSITPNWNPNAATGNFNRNPLITYGFNQIN